MTKLMTRRETATIWPGRVCSIDVESAVDEGAMPLLPEGDQPTIRRALLQRITAISVLEFRIVPEGIDEPTLTSLASPAPEREMLALAEDALGRLGSGGTLVTHNGRVHDLPLIRRRAMNAWLFDSIPSIAAWSDGAAGDHFDTIERLGHGSLVDLCAGLGIPAVVPRRSRARPVDDRIRKSEIDVTATAIAFLHARAADACSSRWLAAAWRDLARYLIGRGARDHLMPLIRRGIELGDALAR